MAYNNNYNGYNNRQNNSYNNERTTAMTKRNYANDTLDTSNPAPRCPVILLLDTSSSMLCGNAIDELNAGLKQFILETSQDEAASMSVELEIINFDDSAHVALPFTPICDVDPNPDPLVADGMTSMGAALRKAAKDLKTRRNLYKQKGISAYRPWVVLMTDGGPNDDWEQAAEEMRKLGERGSIQYIGIETGDDADHDTLCQILPAQPGPVRLKELRFKQFFRWLTDSLKSVSASAVSDQDNIRLGTIRTWADLV